FGLRQLLDGLQLEREMKVALRRATACADGEAHRALRPVQRTQLEHDLGDRRAAARVGVHVDLIDDHAEPDLPEDVPGAPVVRSVERLRLDCHQRSGKIDTNTASPRPTIPTVTACHTPIRSATVT